MAVFYHDTVFLIYLRWLSRSLIHMKLSFVGGIVDAYLKVLASNFGSNVMELCRITPVTKKALNK